MHISNRLYLPEFDFPETNSARLSYMLATIPRSGSTYFAIQLWRTGLLGSPMEYLNVSTLHDQIRLRTGVAVGAHKLEVHEVKGYWERIKQVRTSPNGVFGYKMFMIVFHELIQSYPEIFEDIQPDHILYLTRRDTVAQAISYSKAKQTKTWFADVANAPEARYDFNHIAQCLREIEVQCQYWEGVFAQARIEPIRVTYEDIIGDEAGAISRVRTLLGIPAQDSMSLDIPQIRKQADKTSEDWRERFEQDRSRLGLPLAPRVFTQSR